VSEPPAIGASRAEAHRPVVQEAWAVAVHHGVVVAEAEVPAAVVGDAVVGADAGKQDLEKNKRCRLVTDHWQLITDY
jgi:hypothetical protein